MPPRSSRSASRRPPPVSPPLPSPSSSTTPRRIRPHESGARDAHAPLLRREESPTTSRRAGDALLDPVPQPTPPPSTYIYRPHGQGRFLAVGQDVAGGGGGSSSSGDGTRSVRGKGRRDEPESSQTFLNAPLSRVVQPHHGGARYEIGQEEQDDEGASEGDSDESSGRQVGSPDDQSGSASRQGVLIPTGDSYQQRSRRTRQLPTSYQTAELQKLLSETAFPTTKRRDELATRIGLSSRKIQIWFQNRRQKARRAQEAQPVYPLSPTGEEQPGPPDGYFSSSSYSSWPPPPLNPQGQHHVSQPAWSPDPDNNVALRDVYSPTTSLMGRVLSPPPPGPGIMSSLPPYVPPQPSIFVHEHGREDVVDLSPQDEGRRWEADPREPWHRRSAVSGHSRRVSRRPGSPAGAYHPEAGPSSASTSMPMQVQSLMSGHRGERRPSSPTYGSSPPPPPSAHYHPYAGGRPSRRQGSRSRSPGLRNQRVVSMPSSRVASPSRRRHSAQERTWDSPSLVESAERIMRMPIATRTDMVAMERPDFEDFDLPPLNLPGDMEPAAVAGAAVRAASPRTRLRPTSPSARAAADATRRALGRGGTGSLDRTVSGLMSPRASSSSITAQLETQSPARPVLLPPPFVLEPQPLWDVTSWTPFLHPRRVSWPNSPVRLNERNLPSRYPPPPGPASATGYYLPPWASATGGGGGAGAAGRGGMGASSAGAGPSSSAYPSTIPRRRSPSPRSRQ